MSAASRSPVALTACPLFDGCGAEEIERLEGEGERRDYGPGDIVLRRGEAVDHLFILLRGVARVVMVEADRGGP